MPTRQTAQRRVDRIRAFREELADLDREGVLQLAPDDAARVTAHQDGMVAALAREFDVDVASGQRQLSIGMRLASGFGALALGASVFLFFYHFWDDLTTSAQVTILTTAPLVGLVGMFIAATRERTRYVTGVIGVMTVAAFVLDLSALGQIFNMVPTANAFLAWGAFAIVLAYAVRLRWLLVIGLIGLTMWFGATVVVWTGNPYWWSAFENCETFLLPGIAILLVAVRVQDDEFAPAWRFTGWLVLFVSLLVLSFGVETMLPWERGLVRVMYQIVGLATTAGAITIGVRRHWNETVNLGSIFFALMLLTRLADWWWDWMPGYLFFLVIGLLAVGLILVFRRIRSGMEART
jgi:uncharacterized membrane protein